MKKLLRALYVALDRFFPAFHYLFLYYRSAQVLGDKSEIRRDLFSNLIKNSINKKCMQIGVRKKKYAPHWISVDLFDKSDYIDYNYDVHNLKFKDNTFDIVVCNAILEHVEYPSKAIKELYRVLKKDGLIWVEVPFSFPYHPSPNDYWRVSPTGIRIWMQEFIEISSGFFKLNKSTICTSIFFFGRK